MGYTDGCPQRDQSNLNQMSYYSLNSYYLPSSPCNTSLYSTISYKKHPLRRLGPKPYITPPKFRSYDYSPNSLPYCCTSLSVGMLLNLLPRPLKEFEVSVWSKGFGFRV